MLSNNPKVEQIRESINRNEIPVALNGINQILGKKKNKEKFDERTIEIFHLLKALCLVRTESFGEAEKIFKGFLQKHEKDEVDAELM